MTGIARVVLETASGPVIPTDDWWTPPTWRTTWAMDLTVENRGVDVVLGHRHRLSWGDRVFDGPQHVVLRVWHDGSVSVESGDAIRRKA